MVPRAGAVLASASARGGRRERGGKEGRGDQHGREAGISRHPGKLYKEVGGFRVPIPPPPAIEGRERDENKDSAELMRMMMEDDETMEEKKVS